MHMLLIKDKFVCLGVYDFRTMYIWSLELFSLIHKFMCEKFPFVYNIVITGMKLCACSTAVTDFKKIVSVVGGAGEQQRAEWV